MASLLDFVERIRALQDLPPVGSLVLAGTVADDEHSCVLAEALGCAVGDVETAQGSWMFAMTFDDRMVARRIGIVMGLEWSANPAAVKLPVEISDLAVAQHFGLAEADGLGFLRGWWVGEGDDESEWTYWTPTDELLPDGQWQLPAMGDSSFMPRS